MSKFRISEALMVRTARNEPRADIYIRDSIQKLWGENADAIRAELDKYRTKGEVHVHINSPGGSVSEGMAIYNELIAFEGTVHTHVYGMAASMGSILFLAGDVRTIARGASVLIHKPGAGLFGVVQADQAQSIADTLKNASEAMKRIYIDCGVDEQMLESLYKDDDVVLYDDDAVKYGFAQEVIERDKNENVETAIAACAEPIKRHRQPVDVPNLDFQPTAHTDTNDTTPTNAPSRNHPSTESINMKAIALALNLGEKASEGDIVSAINALQSEHQNALATAREEVMTGLVEKNLVAVNGSEKAFKTCIKHDPEAAMEMLEAKAPDKTEGDTNAQADPALKDAGVDLNELMAAFRATNPDGGRPKAASLLDMSEEQLMAAYGDNPKAFQERLLKEHNIKLDAVTR